ncbi:YbfB/YjiJ family MFS transporter [Enterovirga rhinocerotis]|uniref:Putative MFS family arabinose efflux permease n=1 Tax=Enterovirga rhinocerotis TaxID=1339210 RepID=A0A4R7C6Z7_9HYPH|nr:YbfB/YjiJ family MFS transporter [Enterovirga rhinocerotis]TDR93923.1 putative MFS family arabinose efflux permease [Enterovirga rhinocerotis]
MSTIPAEPPTNSLLPAFAGASATFSGLGLARFAYVPLFPAMVSAGWVSGGEAGLLGALNLAGYLIGVLVARRIAQRIGTTRALDLGMVLVVLAFAGCGWNGGAAWLAACRCLAGIAGGILMVVAGPAVQGSVAPNRRGLAGGILMTGVGTGCVVGAFGVPALLSAGVAATWLGLAALVLVLWLVARQVWPDAPVTITKDALPAGTATLVLSYGFSAAGFVPHMVYLSDFAVRGRGLPLTYGAATFLAFAIGGLTGPLLGGRVADRVGSLTAYRIWLLLQVAAVALAFVPSGPALLLSAFLGGFASVGLTAVTLARARDLAGPAVGAIWARTTAAFALAQAVTGLLMAPLFARTGSHELLFAVALALSIAALAPVLGRQGRPA